ncbi:thiamine pyrophosphate enzyme, N-terminal TPP binding domain protein [Mycobacterium ulcerans str. Harvey]|uniref:acetolactate synthase n=1 Tax=Mycobacterium ulcerans str. Harvey TaxID=1299332 RepID=A0ABP3A6P0_MYCUL|nr:thiamine pyrophosphate enzyme, N-terminal TPP binding domain protein [Mycobacterium ulcerans str. Harvey]
MNGAQALINTLVDGGVDVCFANPGTSEMHFVAALDTVADMRGVLALFEGVATGAADGYARMADKSAAVLLHLGPGLGNGLANLHNARRAGCRWLWSSETTRLTTRSTTPHWNPTSTHWPARFRAGCTGPRRPPMSAPTPPRPSPPAGRGRRFPR